MNAVDDRILVSEFLSRRDETSFRAIYARHAPGVYALAVRISGSPSDGEDLLQETWIRAAERFERFRWDSTLRTWLCGIAVNCWRELLRKRGGPPSAERPRAVGELPEQAAIPRAERVDLERAVRALPDGYREVVVLHDVHGYTHEEIGALLGIEAGTSRSQLLRGRRSLRELLGENGTGKGRP